MTKANITDTSISYIAWAAEAGSLLVDAANAEKRSASLKESVNGLIAKLYKARVTIGRRPKCTKACAFHDALTSGGLSSGTASNYLKVFTEAVKTGKPVKEWNSSRSKNKAKAKGKGGKGKGNASFADLLLKAFNHADGLTFEELCKSLDKAWDDDKLPSIYQGFISYLESEGFEIDLGE